MRKRIKGFYRVIRTFNDQPKIWSYLTSIEYMLQSNLYINSLYQDAKVVEKFLERGDKVLDFGTGSGIFSLVLNDLKKDVKIYGIDTEVNKSQKDPNFSNTVIQQKRIWSEFAPKYQISFSHFNGLKLPFRKNAFAVITACAVVEHIDPLDLKEVFSELRRTLKKGGFLFVFKLPRKWAVSEFLSSLLGLDKHERLFSDSGAKEMFLKEGFLIRKYWRSDLFFEFPGQLTNLIYPLLKFLEAIFNRFPFNLLAHHNNFVLVKSQEQLK